MIAFINKKLSGSISYIVFFLCCIFIYPLEIIKNATAGLDGSWGLSINLAIKNHLIWGKGYVFSYGPLGYLATGIGEYVNHIPIYFFSLGLYLNLCVIFHKIFQSTKTYKVVNLIVLILFFLSIHNFIYREASTYLLLSCVFWLSYSIKNDDLTSSIIATLISILMFFIKMDTGIIINFFMLLFFIYQCLYSKQRKYYPIIWVVNYLLLCFFSYLLPIDLPNYLLANLHVINSYNDAMYVTNSLISIIVSIVVLSCFFCLLIQNYTQIVKSPSKIIITMFLMMVLFILFKHGFVRHEGFTFINPPIPLAILFIFIYFINPENIFFADTLIYFLIPISLIYSLLHSIENINKNDGKLYTYKINILNSVSHLVFHKIYTPPISKSSGKNFDTIPLILSDKFKNEIGNGSVDIIPHLVSTIFFNHLNYNPRPGIQSYANYDNFLDSLGYSKYLSATAPDYLIYCAENKGIDAAIDNRNPFFDEPKTKIAMLQRYSIIDSFGNQLLLKRRDSIKIVSISKPIKSQGSFNQPITIPQVNDLQIMSIKTKYSFLGKLIRFLYQPPSLGVTLTLNNGKQYTFKAIKPNLEEGVLVNMFVMSNKDAVNLFNGNYDSIPKVSNICFNGDKWGFEPRLELASTQISVPK